MGSNRRAADDEHHDGCDRFVGDALEFIPERVRDGLDASGSDARRANDDALRDDDASLCAGRTALARFFAENIAIQANGLERSVTEGADSITGAQAALAE